MVQDKNRYFIELQLSTESEISRSRETEIRRAQAAQFIDQLAAWLHEAELKDKVSSVAITALGQVQITCDSDIISHLRGDESMNIAVIRQSATLADSVYRIGSR